MNLAQDPKKGGLIQKRITGYQIYLSKCLVRCSNSSNAMPRALEQSGCGEMHLTTTNQSSHTKFAALLILGDGQWEEESKRMIDTSCQSC